MVAGIALLVVIIVQLVLLGVALVFRPEALPVGGFVDDFVPTIVSVFGWVVLAFALMQRLNVRPKREEEGWDPISLPPVQDSEPFSQVGTVIEIALGVGLNVILLWRGKWETGTRLAKIALNLFGIGILALLINDHNIWLVEHNAAGFLTAIQRRLSAVYLLQKSHRSNTPIVFFNEMRNRDAR